MEVAAIIVRVDASINADTVATESVETIVVTDAQILAVGHHLGNRPQKPINQTMEVQLVAEIVLEDVKIVVVLVAKKHAQIIVLLHVKMHVEIIAKKAVQIAVITAAVQLVSIHARGHVLINVKAHAYIKHSSNKSNITSNKPNFNIFMKEKKNEEVQSRREFFKQAAKKALPVIGAMILVSSPVISQASEKSNSCNGNCYGVCIDTCNRDCTATCKSTCKGGCKGSCRDTCSTRCDSGCKGGSKGY